MTNAARTVDDLLALWHRCDYCLAEPGDWCVVARGRTAGRITAWLHVDRLWPTQNAHLQGYNYARANTLEEILREIARAGTGWSDLPANPTLADLAALIQKRATYARQSQTRIAERILKEVPQSWRRP